MCIPAGGLPVFAGHLAYLLCLSCLTSVGLVLRGMDEGTGRDVNGLHRP